ncbi:hypothetical protein BDV32DRAFT_153757 [Aspergillus pseudonomiae]|uniref:Uncharacterized protein n=1 Tax=Aspergillus pseudonomiae TaxID=1506151 RepID=A0A5N7DGA8_9EURO|nr:uncharacterized protein BDV37DRAFT_281994 [Aspergillus pseudonomiae]KAB8255919.1 hypothetical protein BDV32DRAFT_153757 [Aspergillus pseudonomiae]KAE8405324.1 hypothetical protein BDV37DRAFT_281994 [Aspergillus pseudonomiae]
MRATLFATILAGSAPLLAAAQAQTTPTTGATTSTETKCAAQNIVDDCKQRMLGQLNDCQPNDWKCLCEQQGNVVTCYNNCPGSAESGPERQKQQVYCNAAKALPSSSTKVPSSTASATEAKKTSTAATSTSTSTGAAAVPTAAFGTVEGGLMLGVVLGVLGL